MAAKVTGGMSKRWLSEIGKSKEVTEVITTVYREAKEKAEAVGRARDTHHIYKHYHYGSKLKKGVWNATWIMWPITNIAKSHAREDLDRAAAVAGGRLKAVKG